MSAIVQQQVKKESASERLFTWFLSVMFCCIFFSFIGVVLAIIGFVTSVEYPGWVKVPWILINILLTLLSFGVIAFIMAIVTQEDTSDREAGMGLCCVFLVGSVVCILKNWMGFQSIVLFLVCIGLTIAGSVALPDQKTIPDPSPIEPPRQEDPHCSVCKKASLYPVCMECERTHQREIQRVRSQNWRAKKAGEPATLTIAEWLQILDTFQHHCAYCQTRPYELMEHYIPIGQGKKDGGTTAKNCVPGCRLCNAGKSNRHPER